ncbi:MAG: hypothetical protein JWL97_2340 [Gemmatimonadales bacterium]|nr:hypothetical protein [Gemmatimonadales bacterium]
MSRKPRWLLACLFCLLVFAACKDDPSGIKLNPLSSRSLVITPDLTLDQSVSNLWTLFPQGLANAGNTRWSNIKRKYTGGQLAEAKQMLVELTAWTQSKTSDMGTPPDGESKTSAASRLVLYMSMYVYAGPNTAVPPFIASADNVVGIVTPGAPATIVTPTKHAGIQLEAGSVAQNTIIVVTQNPNHYPDNCSGPLETRLCQYPQFYTFDEFPHQRFLKPAKINVCHVNSGDSRRPLADHDRFRPAHTKPADPADYTPGSTIRDQNGENIEILPLVSQTFSTCTDNMYAVSSTTKGLLGELAQFAAAVGKRLSPRPAYAIDVGLGGSTMDLSPFNDVDPLGTPDLSVNDYGFGQQTIHPGDHVAVHYTIANLGTASSAEVGVTVQLSAVESEGRSYAFHPPAAPSLVPFQQTGPLTTEIAIPYGIPSGSYSLSLTVGADPVLSDANAVNNTATLSVSDNSNIINLWTLPGDIASYGMAINDAGHAVGRSVPEGGEGIFGDGSGRAFFWANGTMTALPGLGGASSFPRAINISDEIVGYSQLPTGEYRAVRWKNGVVTNLGTLPNTASSYAIGINASGQIAGYSRPSDGGLGRAWIWQNGVMTDLGTLPGGIGAGARAINDAGQVAGVADGPSFPYGWRGFIWQNGNMTALPDALGGHTEPLGMNAQGTVVGAAYFIGPEIDLHAFESSNGVVTDLGPFDGPGFAFGVSNDGRVVGIRWGTSASGAVLWQNGQIIDLGTLGGTGAGAQGINNFGRIIGGSSDALNRQVATIWVAPPLR